MVGLFRLTRRAEGLSLRCAARAAEIDPALLSRFERGQAGLSVGSLARLASVLGMAAIPTSELEGIALAQERPRGGGHHGC